MMTSNIFGLLVFGSIAVMIAALVISSMVHFELGPMSRLAGHQRWILSAALGSGILAFAFKLMLIIVILNFRPYIIDPFLKTYELLETEPVKKAIPQAPRYLWLESEHETLQSPAIEPIYKSSYVWQALPLEAPSPPENPTTPEKVALGERLFNDRSLSRDRSLSCASCHSLYQHAGADGEATATGIGHQIGGRNTPTVWNAAFQSVLFWDGRAASLEEQALGPIFNPIEMGMTSTSEVIKRITEQPDYIPLFAKAFGDTEPVTTQRIAEAIAAYERTLITPDSAYDRFVRGDLNALTQQQIRGMGLFEKIGCIACHTGPNFSTASLFQPSTEPRRIFPASPTPYEAKFNLTQDKGAADKDSDRGVWRVPSLRNVALTGPWIHNGSVKKLSDMVRIMASAQLGLSGNYLRWSDKTQAFERINRGKLNDQQIEDIVAFLNSLSSEELVSRQRIAQNNNPS